VLAELERQQQAAVAEERAADPGAQRQHAFEPLALHDAEALDGSVVEDTRGNAEASGQVQHQIETRPVLGAEVGSRDHLSAGHHSGKTDGQALRGRQL
jgi:hypothetical protein